MLRNHSFVTFSLLVLLLILFGCSSSDDYELCDDDQGVALGFNTCLIYENKSPIANDIHRITNTIKQAVEDVHAIMPVNDVQIRISINPSQVISEIGIGGYNPNQDEVVIYIDPNFDELRKSLNQELAPIIAHELHHVRRRRAVGYGDTMLEAAISEGMADWFSMEVTGIDPPIWSVAIQAATLDYWMEQASEQWTVPAYDHSKWFFGSTSQVPRWTGYSIGFELVKDYIEANPDRKASDLFDEPAESFLP